VIVWLNGPFGVGKTTVAMRLRALVSGSRLFDPEDIGWVLRRLPGQAHRDYQDRAVWRWTTREVARVLARGRTLIVPMTICEPSSFDEIIGGLRAEPLRVEHFTLLASAETIRSRLRGRGSDRRWAEQRLERCLPGLTADRFGMHIETDDRAAVEVADEIRRRIGEPRG
jgi:predicted kinase